MNKKILSLSICASLCLPTLALTNMCVKQKNGKIVRYNIENVDEVFYEKIDSNQVVDEADTPLKFTILSSSTVEVKEEYDYVSLEEIVVPARVQIDGQIYTVTGIGYSAFSYCNLTSIELPSTLTEIKEDAFWGCDNLNSINIPESVTSIGSSAFYSCDNLTSVEISKNVSEFGKSAFAKCDKLSKITVAEDNPYFTAEDNIVYNKEKTKIIFALKNIPENLKIASTVTSIEESAFKYCSTLTNVEIPESVTNIGESAFSGCSALEKIVLPSSITSIPTNLFENCSNLKSVKIPENVTSIEEYAFYGCTSLKEMEIPSSVTSIGYGAFYDCSGLTSINIPESVTSIGKYAFSGCSSLTSIDIPKNITNINYSTFSYCYGLKNVVIPENVTSIDEDAFYYCSSLQSITIPASVNTIEDYAFYGCKSLSEFKIDENNEYFSSKDGVLFNKNKTKLLFVTPTIKGTFTIPATVTSIGNKAFADCTSLNSIEVPANTYFTADAIYGCTKLNSINIDADNRSFSSEDGVVYNKTKTEIICVPNGVEGIFTILSSVTRIGQKAFYNCENLTYILIPESVTYIGDYAFSGCYYLNVDIDNSKENVETGYSSLYNCKSVTYLK